MWSRPSCFRVFFFMLNFWRELLLYAFLLFWRRLLGSSLGFCCHNDLWMRFSWLKSLWCNRHTNTHHSFGNTAIKDVFQELDSNGDGYIDFNEFVEGVFSGKLKQNMSKSGRQKTRRPNSNPDSKTGRTDLSGILSVKTTGSRRSMTQFSPIKKSTDSLILGMRSLGKPQPKVKVGSVLACLLICFGLRGSCDRREKVFWTRNNHACWIKSISNLQLTLNAAAVTSAETVESPSTLIWRISCGRTKQRWLSISVIYWFLVD